MPGNTPMTPPRRSSARSPGPRARVHAPVARPVLARPQRLGRCGAKTVTIPQSERSSRKRSASYIVHRRRHRRRQLLRRENVLPCLRSRRSRTFTARSFSLEDGDGLRRTCPTRSAGEHGPCYGACTRSAGPGERPSCAEGASSGVAGHHRNLQATGDQADPWLRTPAIGS